MQLIIVSLILSAILFPFFVAKGIVPALLNYLPEFLALVSAPIVAFVGMRDRFRNVRPAYWFCLAALIFAVVSGALINSLQPGPMFAGARNYLRALPLFLLPAVFLINDRQLRAQLLLLLALSLIQIPISIEQRLATAARGGFTGDFTFGTLMNAKFLTLYMISSACVLTGFFIRKQLSSTYYFPILFALLFPTFINESKGALILAPMALAVTFFVGTKQGGRKDIFLVAVPVLLVFALMFVPIYDHFQQDRPYWEEKSILDFFGSDEEVARYLNRGVEVGTDDRRAPGKLEGLHLARSDFDGDPFRKFFGVGLGNVSSSALGVQFTGEHFNRYGRFLQNSLTTVVLELGVAGLIVISIVLWLIWRDTVHVAVRDAGLVGALAVGWSGVIVTLVIGLAYHSPIESRVLSTLFWYFSGVLIAHRRRSEIAELLSRKKRAACS